MILSFSVFKDKLESGEKCQTIRKYSPKQYQRFLNTWKKRETTGRYNLYWHNPRNGGVKIKDVVPSDRPFIIKFMFASTTNEITSVVSVAGSDNFISGNQLAKLDGFYSYNEMLTWFLKEYGNALYLMEFMVIRWHNPSRG